MMSADQIEILQRPPFFNRYRFGIGLSTTPESWHRFDELKNMVQTGVAALDCFVQSNSKSYEIYLFSSNPKVIRWMARNHRDFHVNWLRMIDPASWNRTLPAPKPKGKFFNTYSWRIRLSRYRMDMKPNKDGIDCAYPGLTHHAIDAISGPKKVMRQGPRFERTFVYVDRVADVLMLKLILGGDIIEIEER